MTTRTYRTGDRVRICKGTCDGHHGRVIRVTSPVVEVRTDRGRTLQLVTASVRPITSHQEHKAA